MKELLLALVAGLLAQSAIAADAAVPDSFFIAPIGGVDTVYKDTKGRKVDSALINTRVRNLILFTIGASQHANIMPALYAPKHADRIRSLNVLDGKFYDVNGPLIGTEIYTGIGANGPGNMALILADLLISDRKFDRVYIVPLARGGSSIKKWATMPGFVDLVPVAMRRLAARGIRPGMRNVTWAMDFAQGEADNQLKTSTEEYLIYAKQFCGNVFATGFPGRIFIAVETWQLSQGGAWAPVVAGQKAMPDGKRIFQGADTEDLTDPSLRTNGGHFNDVSGLIRSRRQNAAMAASGAPF